MKIKSFSGFTLIELLVVVAIIGVLATVVLASLNSARTKGLDAGIKSNLSNTRAQAEMYYDTNSTYEGVCATSGTNVIGSMVLQAWKALNSGATLTPADATVFAYSSTGGGNAAVCHDTTGAWAAIVSLKSPATASSGWCVDSTGAAKEATALAASVMAC